MRRNLCLPDCNASLNLYKYLKTKPNIKCKNLNKYNAQIHRPCSPHCPGKISPLFLQHCKCKELTFSTSLLPSSVISGFFSFYSLSPCLFPPSSSQSALSISSTQNGACDLLQVVQSNMSCQSSSLLIWPTKSFPTSIQFCFISYHFQMFRDASFRFILNTKPST